MDAVSPSVPQVSNRRRIAFYAVAALFTLLLFAFGVLLFPVYLNGLQAFVTPDPVGAHIVHSVTQSILFGLPLVVMALQLWKPAAKPAGIQQIILMMGVFTVGGAAVMDSYTVLAAIFLLLALVAGALHPVRRQIFTLPRPANRWALALAAVALVAVAGFALQQFQIHANAVPGDEHAEWGHWVTTGVVALSLPLLAALGSLRTPGWRLPAYSAAVSAILFGLISILHRGMPSTLGTGGGALAIVWALVFVAVSELARPDGEE